MILKAALLYLVVGFATASAQGESAQLPDMCWTNTRDTKVFVVEPWRASQGESKRDIPIGVHTSSLIGSKQDYNAYVREFIEEQNRLNEEHCCVIAELEPSEPVFGANLIVELEPKQSICAQAIELENHTEYIVAPHYSIRAATDRDSQFDEAFGRGWYVWGNVTNIGGAAISKSELKDGAIAGDGLPVTQLWKVRFDSGETDAR